jgi:hypothetical protein
MTQALSGAAIAAVIAACWLLGRPRPKLLRSTDTSAVAALNRSQMERVLQQSSESPEAGGSAAGSGAAPSFPSPSDRRGRRQLLEQLHRQFQAGGVQRLQAMALCLAWKHREALPLIRRGLRDHNSEVAALAAAAMAEFRGRSTGVLSASPQPAAARLPRNVSRTR